jgi:Helix-turn-helix domain
MASTPTATVSVGRWGPTREGPYWPPRKGLRPRPRRSPGPQHQGQDHGLCPGLGRPTQAAGPHRGPITRAFLEVLEALLWGFHNSRDGRCFPSYEAIATKAECARSTVAEALKVLEWAGVLTWAHRIARIQVRERDLFGRWASRWRVIRTSNAYVFRDPQQPLAGVPASKSENRSGTQNQEILILLPTPVPDPDSPLERALRHLGGTIEGRLLSNKDSGLVLAS